MLFNSFEFFIYFPIVLLGYFMLPFKFRWIWLLGASYYFYMQWNPKYALLMGLSTIVTYYSGVLLDKANHIEDEKKRIKEKKMWVFLSFFINLSILFFFKYFNFFSENLNSILKNLNLGIKIPFLNVLLPVGISFYTFQALSYTVDVYRGDVKPEKHLGKYALFVSFFPQLVAGPIERSTHLLQQFKNNYTFNYERVKNGLLLMLWGFFKKIVIADRIATVVNIVYNAPTKHNGVQMIIATIFFAFQIYCDFSSYSDIAIGAANIMGYDLMKNFNRPYFSKSIGEFWRRWHISLGTWFKDYLYFPLGGSRVSEMKRYRNLMIVFLISGLWHGASWNFIIWGGLHGAYQVLGLKMKKIRDLSVKKLGINREALGHRIYKVVVTFLLVDFAWIFFRANNFSDAKYIIKNIFHTNISLFLNPETYKLGLDKQDFELAIVVLIILILIEFFQKNGSIIKNINKEFILIRWGIYILGIFFILIFGYYGVGYSAEQFIYFQF